MPTTPSWRPLGGVDAKRLGEARLQAHYAVQWLARLARAAVPPQPDDSHTNLGWDDELDGFVTHRLRDGGRLGLRLSNLRDRGGRRGGAAAARHSRSSAAATPRRASGWGSRSAADGLDAQALDAPSPYAMPSHAIARGGNYGGADLKRGAGRARRLVRQRSNRGREGARRDARPRLRRAGAALLAAPFRSGAGFKMVRPTARRRSVVTATEDRAARKPGSQGPVGEPGGEVLEHRADVAAIAPASRDRVRRRRVGRWSESAPANCHRLD